MALSSNGQLLIRHETQSLGALTALAVPFQLASYQLEPLFPAPAGSALTAAMAVPFSSARAVWSLAKPAAIVQQNPWDVAHNAAAQQNYRAYIEPDIIHALIKPPAATAEGGLNADFPPHQTVSPGWHLSQNFTGFDNVRGIATGRGVRIAHLDTGYTPAHASTPRHMRPDLGWNFWDGNANTKDPGSQFIGVLQPGHGTATTRAISAGRRTPRSCPSASGLR
jgi:hypothetical protein